LRSLSKVSMASSCPSSGLLCLIDHGRSRRWEAFHEGRWMPVTHRSDPCVASLWSDARGLTLDVAVFGGRRLGQALALMMAGGVLEGIGLTLLVPIISLLAPQGSGRWQVAVTSTLDQVGIETRTGQLAAALAAFCILVGVRAAVLTARDRLIFDLTLSYVDDRRRRLITALAHARWSVLARLPHARIAHILSAEIARLDFACAMMLQIAAAGIVLTVQVVLIVWLSPPMAALAVACALAGLMVLVPLSRHAANVGHKVSKFHFRMAGEAAQFLGGLKIAVAHDLADAFVARVAADAAAMRVERDRQHRFQNRVAVTSATLASLVGAAMVLGAVMLGVTTVTLVAALVVLARMSGPTRALQANVQQLFAFLPAFTAVRDLNVALGGLGLHGSATAVGAMAQVAGAQTVPRGGIRFEAVHFAYPNAPTPVFAGLDLSIGAGEMVGLSGPSGTGKTSFVDLLTGLLDPDAGRILVGTGAGRDGGEAEDGMPLGPAILADWRRRLAYVPQDSYLVNASIRENLDWDGAARSDTTLWRALALAGATDLVAAMPAGLDTTVDERGTRLSGGERQRVALARAILRDPDLLILDEATNAIDVATERVVLAGLRRTLPNATILIIAHREETLASCDRVIVLTPKRGPSPPG
jgi:ATP-binding cassette subfamily C protein